MATTPAHQVAGLLRFFPRPTRRSYYPLIDAGLCFGRSEACEVPIPSDLVSRRHAMLERVSSGWRIRDLDSTNGVFVNGERVKSQLLACSDLFRVGSALFRLLPEDLGPGRAEDADPCAVEVDGLAGGIALSGLREALRRAAAEGTSLLLVGEAGAGKAAAARQLHERRGAKGAFVEVDCTGAPDDAELDRQIDGARGGTLFLRRVEALASKRQARLAGALSGAGVGLVASARLSAELDPALRGCFTDSEVRVPPLRERPEDIPLLVQQLKGPSVTVEAMELLCCHTWPDNVRELVATLGEAQHRHQGERLDLEHLGDLVAKPAGRGQASSQALDPAVRQELVQALQRHKGDVNAAAEQIGISRSQLYRRVKTFGLRVADFRERKRP